MKNKLRRTLLMVICTVVAQVAVFFAAYGMCLGVEIEENNRIIIAGISLTASIVLWAQSLGIAHNLYREVGGRTVIRKSQWTQFFSWMLAGALISCIYYLIAYEFGVNVWAKATLRGYLEQSKFSSLFILNFAACCGVGMLHHNYYQTN